jgi:hypothetical protein
VQHSSSLAAPLTAAEIAAQLGPHVIRLIVCTASTDPNSLLGRPGGYTSKVAWVGPRAVKAYDRQNSLPQSGYQAGMPGEKGALASGGIEVFPVAVDVEHVIWAVHCAPRPTARGKGCRIENMPVSATAAPCTKLQTAILADEILGGGLSVVVFLAVLIVDSAVATLWAHRECPAFRPPRRDYYLLFVAALLAGDHNARCSGPWGGWDICWLIDFGLVMKDTHFRLLSEFGREPFLLP